MRQRCVCVVCVCECVACVRKVFMKVSWKGYKPPDDRHNYPDIQCPGVSNERSLMEQRSEGW